MDTAWVEEARDLMLGIVESLPEVWPEDMPPEGTPGLWSAAFLLEKQTRAELSRRIPEIIAEPHRASLTTAQAWMLRRRIEWAAQLLAEGVRNGLSCPTGEDFLRRALIEMWESDGAASFARRAQGGG